MPRKTNNQIKKWERAFNDFTEHLGFPYGSAVKKKKRKKKNPPANAGSIPLSRRPLEKEMASHCSNFAWEIPWTEEPGGLQSLGLQKVNSAHTPTRTIFTWLISNIISSRESS